MTLDHAGSAPPLAVRIGQRTYTLDPAGGVAIIGRDTTAAVRLTDDRISRWHVRLEPRHDAWQAIDTSTNGLFVDGVRRSSVLITDDITLHLGAPDGIPVQLSPGESEPPEPDAEQWWDGEIDPGVVRAGRAVAARRTELDITQRSLARDKVINAGTLIAFEKGRSWPRRATLAKLEKALSWPPGTIMRLRNSPPAAATGMTGATTAIRATPAEEATEVLTDTVQAPLMAEAVELAMHTITAALADLPDPASAEFTPRATNILADLRKLERLASNAARNAKGSPSVVLALSTVRRTYNDLMMRAARSSAATLGQRLYGARHRAELSLEEAANGAGLPVAILEDAEAERPVPPDAAAAIENLIAQLAPIAPN